MKQSSKLKLVEASKVKGTDLSQGFDSRVGGSIKYKVVNPDLQEERNHCIFDKAELELFMFGEEARDEIHALAPLVKSRPDLFANLDFYEKSREEQMEEWWHRYTEIMKVRPEVFTTNSKKQTSYAWSYMFQSTSPLHLHQTMFTKSLKFLGNEEQVAKYLPMADKLQILGCYVQTEMAHGSNVAGLETTATLDMTTDEFVIHTPSQRATKVWAGMLGRHATHAVIFARCIVDGNDYGVQPYLVPIRSLDTHIPFMGIEVGELGGKIGYNTMDNGYISFDHYRIPRTMLLSRFVNIERDGSFEMKGDPRMVYQIMVQTRLAIITGSSITLWRALTIAVRYAVCRRQFSTIKGTRKERKLLDYQTHMSILGTQMANAFVIKMTAQILDKITLESNAQVDQGSFKLLDILHHFTSGMKAVITELAYNGGDELRKTCGGAAFLDVAQLGQLFQDSSPLPTFEGVNIVMLQQSSRYLLKQANKAMKGKTCTGYFTYINHLDDLVVTKSAADTPEKFLELKHLELAFAVRSAFHVRMVWDLLKESKAPEVEKQNDLFSLDIQRMTRNHLNYMMFKMSMEAIKTHKFKDRNTYLMLKLLLRVWAVKELASDTAGLYEKGFFISGSGRILDEAFKSLLNDLRPHMVSLAEFSPATQTHIASTIGNEYGDIYEAQLAQIKRSKMNQRQVPPYYNKYMKPLMTNFKL